MFIAWGIANVVKNEKNKNAAAQHTCPECGEKKRVDAVVLKRETPKAAKVSETGGESRVEDGRWRMGRGSGRVAAGWSA
ncbi:hypothetical protein B0A54_14646 [Friedmanniomyces endolithicus]|uniref:Uncharacterized protein n=1 Tax=Friedmanniomyces endolithicus TaxID=329885 RepID=A0A4V6WJY4_9PEZI|nr:hypothetical protein B0A54_14646 [Friedmanniomyces endolithicus]